jgi:hypothetical protein
VSSNSTRTSFRSSLTARSRGRWLTRSGTPWATAGTSG